MGIEYVDGVQVFIPANSYGSQGCYTPPLDSGHLQYHDLVQLIFDELKFEICSASIL